MMTPRQIIQQISERRHLQNITEEGKVNFEKEKFQNVNKNTSECTNKNESEANKEIRISKLEEYLPRAQRTADLATILVDTTARMYPTLGHYLQGNAISTKTKENEVNSATRSYDCNKDRERNTPDMSFSTWYTTFKDVGEASRRHQRNVVPKPRRIPGTEGTLEHGYLELRNGKEISNIRGMAKKIHDKSLVMEHIITTNEEISGRKHFEERRQFEGKKQSKEGERSGTRNGEIVENNTKRVRLHIYVPTAEMNSW